jgi:phage protein D
MASDDLKSLTPTFIVYINGTRISVDQEAAVKRIVVQDRLDAPATCSLILSDPKRQWTDSKDFSEGNQVSVHLGYKDKVAEVFNGEIIGMVAEFRRGTDGIVTVRASTTLHRLARAKKTLCYNEKSDADILKQIVSDCGLSFKGSDISTERTFVARKDRSDYEFLMDLARRNGCRVWAKEKEIHVKKAPDRAKDSVIVEWGKTLLEFHADSDCRKIFTEVEVIGWNNEKAKAVTGKAAAADISNKIGGDKLGAKIVKDNFSAVKMVVMDQEVVDANSADALAKELLTANSFSLVSAEGKSEGNQKIIAGATLTIKEAGDRFSGDYLVNSVKHQFESGSGYTSVFSLTRNAI